MKETVRISDMTLGAAAANLIPDITFRERIEVAKLLDKLGVSVIELGSTASGIADNLLIKSVASVVNDSVIAVCPGMEPEAIAAAWNALKTARHPRLQVSASLSTSRMEYVHHKKADDLLQTAANAVRQCRALCEDVEFVAEDATRADREYLCRTIAAVIDAGATTVCVCDSAGVMLPDEFGAMIGELREKIPGLAGVTLAVCCSDALSVANACTVAAIRAGAREVELTALPSGSATLEGILKLLSAREDAIGVSHTVRDTELQRFLQNMKRICGKEKAGASPFEDGVRQYPADLKFSKDEKPEELAKGAALLGYELDEEDLARVDRAFRRIAERKEQVSIGELEAIIASEAVQVPPTYQLESYVVTTGNAIGIVAHVRLKKEDEIFDGLSLGDGPIDAAFLAIEKITGHHYELDDFQLQAVTEGREAMGQTIVKLRANGKLYAGRGISTDIVGSGVAAYVNALNKILYEEERA